MLSFSLEQRIFCEVKTAALVSKLVSASTIGLKCFMKFQKYPYNFKNISYQYCYWQCELQQTAFRPNHTSYRKCYFTDFFQNSMLCNMGLIFMKASRGQKHPLYMKGCGFKAFEAAKLTCSLLIKFDLRRVMLVSFSQNVVIMYKWLSSSKHS